MRAADPLWRWTLFQPTELQIRHFLKFMRPQTLRKQELKFELRKFMAQSFIKYTALTKCFYKMLVKCGRVG